MKTAQPTIKIALMMLVFAGALVAPKTTWASAGSLQICEPGATCEIGEFIYNDDYTPVTSSATCRITSRYPDGTTSHLGNLLMTQSSNSDGWYSYEFTAPTTEGMYRTQVCCVVSGETMCVDKSFEVKADVSAPSTDDISSAVWGYSSRTLSGFGTLARDIWLNSERSLTSLITGSTDITENITNIEKATDDSRLLLEELVNKPIIETFLEDDEIPDLEAKLEETDTASSKLFVNTQYMVSKTMVLAKGWNGMSSSESGEIVSELSYVLGEQEDETGDTTIFGQINWFKDNWGFESADEAFELAGDIKSMLSSIQRGTGRFLTLSEMKRFATSISRLEKAVGSVSDSSRERTVFGQTKEVKELAVAYDSETTRLDKFLTDWDGYSERDKERQIMDDVRKVLALNKLPRIKQILPYKFADGTEDREYKNAVLGMKGVLASNKIYLAKRAGATLGNTWLEEGSIVFKTLVTNPSTLISQTVAVKFYLPAEVREEHVIETDDELEISYDAEKDLYYAKGDVTLGVGETQTLVVRVDDIWVISDEEVESMRNQAAELSRPLEKTSYFAQGVTLKSDIDVSLDKIVVLQKSAVTPEARVRAYREARLELEGVKDKMIKLQDLATGAGSAGTMFGFVGGAQTLAVWGLIIIMVAGFVFLALYMKVIRRSDEVESSEHKSEKTAKTKSVVKKPVGKGKVRVKMGYFYSLLVATSIFSAVASSVVTGMVVNGKAERRAEKLVMVQEPEPVLGMIDDQEEVVEEEPEEVNDSAVGGEDIVLVEVPEGSSVNVRELPTAAAVKLGSFGSSTEVVRIGEENGWVKILYGEEGALDGNLEAWVHGDFVKNPSEVLGGEMSLLDEYVDDEENDFEVFGGVEKMVVLDTPTGWLRVRESAWGAEIGKVYPGDECVVVNESGEWYEIEFEDSTGWAHSSYVEVL